MIGNPFLKRQRRMKIQSMTKSRWNPTLVVFVLISLLGSRGRGFNKGQFRGRGNRNGSSTQKGESRYFLCQSLEHWVDKCPNRTHSSRGRGFNKGQYRGQGGHGGYGQSSKTASIETHHSADHACQASSIKGDSQQQQQQQPPQLEDSGDPYFHINQALVELNPYSHQ